jgi:hypothetical protein
MQSAKYSGSRIHENVEHGDRSWRVPSVRVLRDITNNRMGEFNMLRNDLIPLQRLWREQSGSEDDSQSIHWDCERYAKFSENKPLNHWKDSPFLFLVVASFTPHHPNPIASHSLKFLYSTLFN